ncbi:S1 family peptidase [Streptosporangium sp. NBC_01810]|uniref:S1 family peptidase n=1 Tax=Streptosporangium sp. NBC_01810 TaxID=2975951 RepID=UPI002DD92ACB|nr:S1 family peptidase [Streptosporangium sp. NBC_01810]WSA25762.1 S1 family peptidase [Streptosporangium sp. NBC_01810]
MSRRHVVAMGCVLAVTGLTLTGVPAAAGPRAKGVPVTVPAWKPPSGMLEALQRDLELTREQAQARLLNEARLTGVAAELRTRLGNRFGGSWLMGTIAQTLVVATTDEADIPHIIAAGARAEVVKRSLAELDKHIDSLDQTVPGPKNEGSVRYVDARNNRVVVLSSEPLAAEDLIESAGVDTSVVKVVPSTERPRLLSDVQGGDAYYVGVASRCSVGFSVTHEAQVGFVSAGHCGKAGDATTGFNRIPQGVFKASAFPGRDYAWVEVNAGWTPKPVVSNGSGGAVPVAGSRAALEGASVCRSGSTTDWHCGIIRQLNASVTYPQGTIHGLGRTSVCAEPGDSGGSFISVDQAQGVTSGGSGDCTTSGVTYFQPVNEILAAYGLTLLTASTAPSSGDVSPGTIPSGKQDCAGYPKTYTGTLNDGQSVSQPSRYYRAAVTGTHSACLDGGEGVDFDLYLQRWQRSVWVTVATSEGAGPDEQISYIGLPGFYRYRLVSASGSGPYTLKTKSP